jgi:5,10-methylenetetrahydrofolate reductase
MRMKEKLLSGEFVLLAEMEPPKGTDISEMLANATRVRGKVDAFMIPEMSNAVMRMSSLGGCMLLQGKGLDTVMQACCRDRNRLALQADLLAANALGISIVIAVTGEDPSFGDHPGARAVNDVNLLELLDGIKKLQTGRDMAGIELKGAPSFCVGSVVNAGASGGALDIEIQEMERKIEAGVEFFITPPVFDLQSLGRFMKRVAAFNPRIIPRVMLLKSVGMARYIQRYLEHMHISEDVIRRIEQAPDRIRECVRIAAELVSAIKEAGYSGVLVSTIGWEDKLPGILGE